MNKITLSVFTVFLLPALFLSGCGDGTSAQDELKMVPGLCFLHVHIGDKMNIGLFPDEFSELIPIWLCDSLNVRGSFGVSLLGVNLTDFSPQLLFLSREVSPDEMLQLCTAGFQCSSEESSGHYDLVDSRGGMIGSIAGRDGWTCLVTGSGSDRSAGRWLELDAEESLASDSALISISEFDYDLTVLISHNSIAFVSLIPTGMLSRSQIAMLERVKELILVIDPRGIRISLEINNEEEPPVTLLELQLVRGGDKVSTISLRFSDTELTAEDLLRMIGGEGY